ESFAVQTGCWLYFAVQHPDSKSPFVHYSSHKLRREGASDLQVIHQEVGRTMSALVRADRVSKVDIIRSQAAAEEKASEALYRATKAEDELERLKKLLSALSSQASTAS
ncbi:hypothetical protein BKA70DRAFT_1108112, partial [Coprinopsis sp. MPI-PUGE-AT-0042]